MPILLNWMSEGVKKGNLDGRLLRMTNGPKEKMFLYFYTLILLWI